MEEERVDNLFTNAVFGFIIVIICVFMFALFHASECNNKSQEKLHTLLDSGWRVHSIQPIIQYGNTTGYTYFLEMGGSIQSVTCAGNIYHIDAENNHNR